MPARYLSTPRRRIDPSVADPACICWFACVWGLPTSALPASAGRILFGMPARSVSCASATTKTIGDLLGHRSARSTRPYLKLATDDLRAVALEIPREGGASMNAWPDVDGNAVSRHLRQLRLRTSHTARIYRGILSGFQRLVEQRGGGTVDLTIIVEWLRERARHCKEDLVEHQARVLDRFLDFSPAMDLSRSIPWLIYALSTACEGPRPSFARCSARTRTRRSKPFDARRRSPASWVTSCAAMPN